MKLSDDIYWNLLSHFEWGTIGLSFLILLSTAYFVVKRFSTRKVASYANDVLKSEKDNGGFTSFVCKVKDGFLGLWEYRYFLFLFFFSVSVMAFIVNYRSVCIDKNNGLRIKHLFRNSSTAYLGISHIECSLEIEENDALDAINKYTLEFLLIRNANQSYIPRNIKDQFVIVLIDSIEVSKIQTTHLNILASHLGSLETGDGRSLSYDSASYLNPEFTPTLIDALISKYPDRYQYTIDSLKRASITIKL